MRTALAGPACTGQPATPDWPAGSARARKARAVVGIETAALRGRCGQYAGAPRARTPGPPSVRVVARHTPCHTVVPVAMWVPSNTRFWLPTLRARRRQQRSPRTRMGLRSPKSTRTTTDTRRGTGPHAHASSQRRPILEAHWPGRTIDGSIRQIANPVRDRWMRPQLFWPTSATNRRAAPLRDGVCGC